MAKAYIGTSGWAYKSWKGAFFPEDLKESELLDYYQEHFNSVEINSSFYRLPKPQTVRNWADKAPAGFRYTFKASRYISHIKKLKDPDETIGRFMDVYKEAGTYGGPVLLQLPPSWTPSPERLGAAIDEFFRAKPDIKLAGEFRNRDSYDDPLFEVLDEKGAALVIHDMGGSGTSATNPEAPFIFMRYHGAQGKKYAGNYDDERLSKDAKRIKDWLQEGRDVYAYFNNDAENFAPWNAQTLSRIVESGEM